MTVLEWARSYVAAGLSVMPIRTDGAANPHAWKAPALSTWTHLKDRRPSDDELREWFDGKNAGVAIVGGGVSGGLVVMDFETEEAYFDWLVRIGPMADQVADSPLAVTPGGGRHLYIRCPHPTKNQKLARNEHQELAIETRGAGGYAVAPGSPPECHPTGNIYTWERLGWIR